MDRVARLLIVYDVPGYAYHRRALALQKFAPPDFLVDLMPVSYPAAMARMVLRDGYDAVFLLDYASAGAIRDAMLSHGVKAPLITSFNRDSKSRRDHWVKTRQQSDLVIVNNLDRWENDGGPFPKTVCIPNGVDTDIFRTNGPIGDREKVVLWTGSANEAKGKGYRDILKPLEKLLPRYGYKVWFRPIRSDADRFDTAKMVEFYNTGTCILCASESEGTPNTTLEAMACGCVPVTTWVGNIREFGVPGKNCLRVDARTPEAFATAVHCLHSMPGRVQMGYHAHEVINYQGWDWRTRSQVFYRLFWRVIKYGTESIKPYSYLTEENHEAQRYPANL